MRKHFKGFNLSTHGNQTYDLKSLTSEALELLNKVIDHYEQLPLSYPYNNGKNATEYLNDITKMAASGDKYNRFKLKQEIAEHKRLRMLRDWYEYQATTLDDEHFWNMLSAQRESGCQRALQKLHQQWQKQSRFATYGSFALYLTAQLLSSIESYLQFALFEFQSRQRNLPRDFCLRYQHYLTNFAEHLQNEKQALQFAMLARLQLAASQQDITCDDIVIVTIHQLQKLKVIDDFATPKPRRSLTPFLAHEFQLYLNKSEQSAIKQAAHQLPWFTHHFDGIETTTIHYKEKFFLIPKLFINDIPKKPNKLPQWLTNYFPGHNMRFQLFQTADAQNILKLLKNLPILQPMTADDLATLNENPLLQQLRFCHEFIRNEWRRLQSHSFSHLSTLLQKRTIIVIKKYRVFLQGLGEEIVKHFNALMDVLMQTLNETSLTKMYDDVILQIEALLHETEGIASFYECSPSIKKQIQKKQSQIQHLLLLNNTESFKRAVIHHTNSHRITQHIEQLKKGIPIPIDQIKQIIGTYQQIQTSSYRNTTLNDAQVLLKFQIESFFNKIPELLQRLLHENPLQLPQPSWVNHVSQLTCYTLLWTELPSSHKVKFNFQDKLRRYVLNFLDQLLQLNLSKHFLMYKERFTAICRTIFDYGDSNLKAIFETLNSIINESDINWGLFRIFTKTTVLSLIPKANSTRTRAQPYFFQTHLAEHHHLTHPAHQITQQPH